MCISDCSMGKALLAKTVQANATVDLLKKRPVGSALEQTSRSEQFNTSKGQLWRRHVHGCDICQDGSQIPAHRLTSCQSRIRLW